MQLGDAAAPSPRTPPRDKQASAELRSPCEEPYTMPRSELCGTQAGRLGVGAAAGDVLAAVLAAGATVAVDEPPDATLAGKPNAQPTEPASGPAAGASSAGATAASLEGQVAVDTRRTPEAIAATKPKKDSRAKTPRDDDAFLALPHGPFLTQNDAHTAVDRFCVAAGYRRPVKEAARRAEKYRGAQFTLACPYSKLPRASAGAGERATASSIVVDPDNLCHWSVTFEESTVGWVILHAVCTHSNHTREAARVLSAAEATLTFDKYRSKVPDQLIDLVTDDMKQLRLSVEVIKNFIDRKAAALDIEVKWTYQDIHNVFSTSAAEKACDATGLVEQLQKRSDEKGMQFKFSHGDEGRLERIFFEIDGGLDFWALNGDRNTVLFDMTWGTNIYGMKLGCFTTIGRDGRTIILAACIIMREDLESFTWAFRCFATVFKYAPEVIITDGDVAMGIAIKDVFPSARHHLCIFHLSLNLNTNLFPLFASDKDGWHRVLDTFWRLAKETDVRSRKSFEADFDELIVLVQQSRSSEEQKKAKALSWLNKLRERAHQWAYRFTWQYLTLGADSSQRSEAVHSAIKRLISTRMTLTELVNELVSYSNLKELRKEMLARRRALLQAYNNSSVLPAVAQFEKLGKVSSHAIEVLRAQAAQACKFEVAHAADGTDGSRQAATYVVAPMGSGAAAIASAYGAALATARAGDGAELAAKDAAIDAAVAASVTSAAASGPAGGRGASAGSSSGTGGSAATGAGAAVGGARNVGFAGGSGAAPVACAAGCSGSGDGGARGDSGAAPVAGAAGGGKAGDGAAAVGSSGAAGGSGTAGDSGAAADDGSTITASMAAGDTFLEALRAVDAGLAADAPAAFRITSLHSCSCQFSQHTGHRLAVRQRLQVDGTNVDALSPDDFAQQWHSVGAPEQHDARLRLFHAVANLVERTGPSQVLSREEIMRLMVQEARVTAAQCAHNAALVQKFRARMKELFDEAIGGAGGGANVVANPTTKRARKAAETAAAIATTAGEGAEQATGRGRGRGSSGRGRGRGRGRSAPGGAEAGAEAAGAASDAGESAGAPTAPVGAAPLLNPHVPGRRGRPQKTRIPNAGANPKPKRAKP